MWNLLKEIVGQTTSNIITDLDKAVEKDEIDTVTFGLETDDGNVVKVYVQADQADMFEKELSQAFGQKDDIEKVLNELSKKYNIVDVHWPDSDGDVAPDDESAKSEDDDLSDELSDGSESQTEFSDEKEEKGRLKIAREGFEEDTYGRRFVAKYLEEAEAKQTPVKGANKGKGNEDVTNNEGDIIIDENIIRFSNANQRLVYDMIQLLGINAYIIRQRRMHFIKIIRNTALELQRDSRMSNLMTRLRIELESNSALREGAEEKTEDKKIDDQLTTINAKRIKTILMFLGVTNDDMKFWWTKTRKNIMTLARNLQVAPRTRYLVNQIYARITQEEVEDVQADKATDTKK